MRVIVRGSRSVGRHDQRPQIESDMTYRLQAGAAKVALDHKRRRPMTDAYGTPLPLSTGLAEGYSERRLEQMSRGRTRTIVSLR